MYCIKSFFKDSPIILISTVFCLNIIIFSFAFRVAERNASPSDHYDYYSRINNYQNSVWMTIITMTGIGYGEITPQTNLGHIIAIICISWGSLNISTMVVVLVNVFSLKQK
jgi:hypothetical protein